MTDVRQAETDLCAAGRFPILGPIYRPRKYHTTGYFFLEVLVADVRSFKHMVRHIKTLEMDEEDAKADYARHNEEVLAHVNPDKVLPS